MMKALVAAIHLGGKEVFTSVSIESL